MSQGPASAYAEITREVDRLGRQHQVGNDPTVSLYMIARAALLSMRALRGHKNAAELAYKIADELSTSGPEAVG